MIIRYDDMPNVGSLLKDLRYRVFKSDEIDQAQVNFVNLVRFGDSGLEINFRAYTKTVSLKEFLHVRENLLIDFSDILHKHGAQLAYPTSKILLKKSQSNEKKFKEDVVNVMCSKE